MTTATNKTACGGTRRHGTCPDCATERDDCCAECGCCSDCGPCAALACYQIRRVSKGDGAEEFLIPVVTDGGTDLYLQSTSDTRGTGDFLGIFDLDGADVRLGASSWEWAKISAEQAQEIADDWEDEFNYCEIEEL